MWLSMVSASSSDPPVSTRARASLQVRKMLSRG